MDIESLRRKCEAAGQGQLLQFWEKLSPEEQEILASQIAGINLQEVNSYLQEAKQIHEEAMSKTIDKVEPPDPEMVGRVKDSTMEEIETFRKLGQTALGNNEVASVLMAGGQGSRVGISYPKGMFDVGLPSGRSLYQILGERILKLQRMTETLTGKSCCIPWYIMTSEANHHETVSFLVKHNYFGLNKENVIVFKQRMLPCFDMQGKILLESPHKMFLAPDGNGDLYRAMREEGALEDMLARGIKHLHVYSVENILLRVADPVFIGHCIYKNLAVGVKGVEKLEGNEALTVVGKADGVFRGLHYHELVKEVAEKRGPDGRLVFNEGVLGDLYYCMDFMKHLCQKEFDRRIKYHFAHKKIPFIDVQGKLQHPETPNGLKLEKFLFDDFNFPQKLGMWQIIREDEFMPSKNPDGEPKDTPTTCREAIFDLHRRYILSAGGKFVQPQSVSSSEDQSSSGGSKIVCEISPLLSYAGEGLEEAVRGKSFVPPLLLELAPDNVTIIIKQGIDLSQP